MKSSQCLHQKRRSGSAPLQEPLPLLANNGPRGLTAADVLAQEGKGDMTMLINQGARASLLKGDMWVHDLHGPRNPSHFWSCYAHLCLCPSYVNLSDRWGMDMR